MWIPANVDEIEAAIAAARLEETATFDGKEAIPVKNAETAKDIAAMATAGGTILYGVGEDENGHLTKRAPIELAGAGDRIGQVVATSISEVPHIEIHEYPTVVDPARGFLLVVVPQSARAPHQVTVGKDHRFYGRGAKANLPLGEAEIARLYAQRQLWATDRLAILSGYVANPPVEPKKGYSYVHAYVRPLLSGQRLLDRAAGEQSGDRWLLDLLVRASGSVELTLHVDPSFSGGSLDWQRLGADAWRLSKWPVAYYGDSFWTDAPDTLLEVTVHSDGSAHMFCGRGAYEDHDPRLILEATIAASVGSFVAMMNAVYKAAGFAGHVDVGIAVTNLLGAGSARMQGGYPPRRYGQDSFSETARWAAAELGNPEERTRELAGRFFEASSGIRGYDPFVDKR